VKEKVRFIIIGKNQVTSDMPDYASLASHFPDYDWDLSRGISATGLFPSTSGAEENLLCLASDPYSGENIAVHEFAHTIAGSGGNLPSKRVVERGGTRNLNNAIIATFNRAKAKGLWQNTYAATNFQEYWAEGVQSFFNSNMEGPRRGNGIHNFANSRAELRAYDSGLEALIAKVFPFSNMVSFECPSSTCSCSNFVCPSGKAASINARTKVPTHPPTRRPIKAGRSKNCFSGATTVFVKNKGLISMNQLQIGDAVLSADHEYDTVYSFGHYSEARAAEYQLFLPSMLQVSPNHLVFLQEGNAVTASSVKVGDVLLHGGIVTGIQTVTARGVYAPFTSSGTIMVNGVGASCYVSLQGSESLTIGSFSTGLSHHFLAHALLLPRRMWCSGGCEDSYTEDGIAAWVEMPLQMAQWCLQQPAIVLSVIMIPLGCLLTLFFAMDLLLCALLAVWLIHMIHSTAIHHWRKLMPYPVVDGFFHAGAKESGHTGQKGDFFTVL